MSVVSHDMRHHDRFGSQVRPFAAPPRGQPPRLHRRPGHRATVDLTVSTWPQRCVPAYQKSDALVPRRLQMRDCAWVAIRPQERPTWQDFDVEDAAFHLGSGLGPTGLELSWISPLRKSAQRFHYVR